MVLRYRFGRLRFAVRITLTAGARQAMEVCLCCRFRSLPISEPQSLRTRSVVTVERPQFSPRWRRSSPVERRRTSRIEPSALLLTSALGAVKYRSKRSGEQTSISRSSSPMTRTLRPSPNARGCCAREPRKSVSGAGRSAGGPVIVAFPLRLALNQQTLAGQQSNTLRTGRSAGSEDLGFASAMCEVFLR